MSTVKKRVLVVDDDPELVASVRAALLTRGYDVSVAGDGAEAFVRLRQEEVVPVIVGRIGPGTGGERRGTSHRGRGPEHFGGGDGAGPGFVPGACPSGRSLDGRTAWELGGDAIVGGGAGPRKGIASRATNSTPTRWRNDGLDVPTPDPPGRIADRSK